MDDGFFWNSVQVNFWWHLASEFSVHTVLCDTTIEIKVVDFFKKENFLNKKNLFLISKGVDNIKGDEV